MVSDWAARGLAMSLPGVTEQDHHGFPSFRVDGRIFATLPAPGRLRAMADEECIRGAAAIHPAACSEYFWGKRLACVEVQLDQADTELVRELVVEAWRHKRRR